MTAAEKSTDSEVLLHCNAKKKGLFINNKVSVTFVICVRKFDGSSDLTSTGEKGVMIKSVTYTSTYYLTHHDGHGWRRWIILWLVEMDQPTGISMGGGNGSSHTLHISGVENGSIHHGYFI